MCLVLLQLLSAVLPWKQDIYELKVIQNVYEYTVNQKNVPIGEVIPKKRHKNLKKFEKN